MKILHLLARLLVVFCLLLSVGLAIGTWFAYSHSKQFLATSVHADGTVVANIAKPSGDNNSNVLFPQFIFQTPDGVTHTITSDSGSSPPSYSIGQHVAVLYAPGKPDSAVISGFMSSWFLPMMLAIFAVVTLFAALFWIVIDTQVIAPKLREHAS